MACLDCKGNKKQGSGGGVNLSALSTVLKLIIAAFKTQIKPAQRLPPPLLHAGAQLRPGLSARNTASRIISRQAEAGAPFGDIFSESGNIAERMEVIRVQEIYNSLQTEAKIQVAVPPGLQSQGIGITGYPGTPMTINSITTAYATGDGVIQ